MQEPTDQISVQNALGIAAVNVENWVAAADMEMLMRLDELADKYLLHAGGDVAIRAFAAEHATLKELQKTTDRVTVTKAYLLSV